MRKIYTLMALALLATILPQTAPANCQEYCGCWESEYHFYGKVTGGGNSLHSSKIIKFADGNANVNKTRYKPGFFVSGAAGYRFCDGLNLEAEFAYRQNDIRKISHLPSQIFTALRAHVNTWSVMANALYEFPVCSWLQPYFGGGIGYAENRVKASIRDTSVHFSHKRNHFAWQGIAGLAFRLSDRVDLTTEYRYFQSNHNLKSHSYGAGLKFYF